MQRSIITNKTRENAIRVFCGILLLVMLIMTVSFSRSTIVSADSDYEQKLKEAEENRKALVKRKKETQVLLDEFKEAKSNIEEYINELDLQLNDISLKLFDLQEKVKVTEGELEVTKEDLRLAKEKESEQYDIMKRRIQYMYENGETTYADVVLASDSIEDMLNQSEYMASITEYDNNLLNKYKKAKQEVIEKETFLEASLEELNSLKDTAELEKDTVDELIELKAKEIERFTEQIGITDELLFSYIDEISNQDMEIEEIKEEEERRLAEEERKRQEELERIRKAEEEARLAEERRKAAAAAAEGKLTSTDGYDADAINDVIQTDETDIYKMIWPLPGDHRTFSKFGKRIAPTKGASTYHKGWDIGGEFGAPMVAVLAGTVIAAGNNSSGGNYIRIDHGNGVFSIYCHCSKFLVSQGDYVKQGQKIALVGSTGVSTSPHLHFAVALSDGNGSSVYVDPDPYIGHLE